MTAEPIPHGGQRLTGAERQRILDLYLTHANDRWTYTVAAVADRTGRTVTTIISVVSAVGITRPPRPSMWPADEWPVPVVQRVKGPCPLDPPPNDTPPKCVARSCAFGCTAMCASRQLPVSAPPMRTRSSRSRLKRRAAERRAHRCSVTPVAALPMRPPAVLADRPAASPAPAASVARDDPALPDRFGKGALGFGTRPTVRGIAAEIVRKGVRGEWAVLPAQDELATHFHVCKKTIIRATRLLAERGQAVKLRIDGRYRWRITQPHEIRPVDLRLTQSAPHAVLTDVIARIRAGEFRYRLPDGSVHNRPFLTYIELREHHGVDAETIAKARNELQRLGWIVPCDHSKRWRLADQVPPVDRTTHPGPRTQRKRKPLPRNGRASELVDDLITRIAVGEFTDRPFPTQREVIIGYHAGRRNVSAAFELLERDGWIEYRDGPRRRALMADPLPEHSDTKPAPTAATDQELIAVGAPHPVGVEVACGSRPDRSQQTAVVEPLTDNERLSGRDDGHSARHATPPRHMVVGAPDGSPVVITRARVAVVRALVGGAGPSTAKDVAARAHHRLPTSDTGLAWLGILDWVRRGDGWRHGGPVRVYELTERGRVEGGRLLAAWDGDGG